MLDEAVTLALLCDLRKVTFLLWANERAKVDAPLDLIYSLESVFRFCGLIVPTQLGEVWGAGCVCWGEAAGFWLPAGWPAPGDAPAEPYLCVNLLSAPVAHQALLGIYLPPLRPPTHFTFVREKLEEPELPFLTSATPWDTLGSDESRGDNREEETLKDEAPHFLTGSKWCIPVRPRLG